MPRKPTRRGKRLTGKALIALMKAFLAEHAGLRGSLKVTTEASPAPLENEKAVQISVHVVWCQLLEKFLDVLELPRCCQVTASPSAVSGSMMQNLSPP